MPAVREVPPLPYRFTPAGPAGAPDPARADVLLSRRASRDGGRRLHRAWREPFGHAPGGATWVYVLRVADGTDELKTHSGLTSCLWTDLREKWQLEVAAEDASLTPYQAAALAAGHLVWTA